MKKVVSILTVIVFLLSLALPASAIENLSASGNFIAETEKFLTEAVYSDSEYSLSEVPSLTLGSKIPTYIVDDCTQASLEPSEVQYYPVLSSLEIIGLLGVYEKGGEYIFSYSEAEAGIISSALDKGEGIALVWVNNQLQALTPSNSDTVAFAADLRRINFQDPLADCNDLSLVVVDSPSTTYPSSYSLTVTTKLQSYDWDCWAASTACIGQYHSGLSYTSAYVASKMNTLTYANFSTVKSALKSIYSYTATYPSGYPSYKTICSILYSKSKPIATGLIPQSGSVGHMVVVYGYATGSSYSAILVMNPSSGKMTISISDTSTPMTLILSGNIYSVEEYLY